MASVSVTLSAQSPTPSNSRSRRRDAVLATVLDPRRLPTPPAVALQVVSAASRPDCNPNEIVRLLSQDPALCAKLLKAVNSCLYGLSKPIASLERAITVLGLGPVRSLALGLSLPAIKTGPADPETRAYQITSVAGAIIARDLSARTPRSSPADDMVAGLLRDMGAVLLQQTYPDAWRDMTERWGDHLLAQACEAEEETFGINHADVTAELLSIWKLPPEIVQPIRFHHNPEQLAGAAKAVSRRAELLYFSGLLASLDTVVRHPTVLEYVLDVARTQYGLPKPELIRFMRGIVPKIIDFGELLNRDVRDCPNFAEALTAGGQELVNLAVETNRTRLSGAVPTSGVRQIPVPGGVVPPSQARSAPAPGGQVPQSHARPAPTPAPSGHGTSPQPAPQSQTQYDVWSSAGATLDAGTGRRAAGSKSGPTLPEFRPGFLEQFPVSGCQLGDYELREILGRGAMGIVFKGYEPSLARFVAIKMLAPETSADPRVRERFAREARAGAAVRHENVVTIYAVRELGGISYLAMEYVQGVALDRYIEKKNPLPVTTIVQLARQIALGLAAAHKRGIIHRDIKPANIILEYETNTAKIADFGLARNGADGGNLSQTGGLIGTPYFMAPEQIQGQPATVASDLFSLGGVLYSLCTGIPPFPEKSLAAVLYAVCSAEPKPIYKLRSDIPQWLEDVVMKLLSKDPTQRFKNASEVADALIKSTH
ncbi:protein kinase domain-containing protein [Gemmata massiliana]|uniref:protein kinase domain-containing protein n=1 Tax=Gemmata massiliana TaxID=1210884 RepID=UPI0013A6FFAF